MNMQDVEIEMKEMEKERFGDQLDVEFVIDVQNKGIETAPLPFMPLIENSFKHGANNKNHVKKINIELKTIDYSKAWNWSGKCKKEA